MAAETVSFDIHDEVAMAPANNAMRRKLSVEQNETIP